MKSAAADLNYKVIEVNTSQCRSHKNIISQLKDGLITHKVSSSSSSTDGMDGKSLILVDDADVVMAEDSNFLQVVCLHHFCERHGHGKRSAEARTH